MTVSTRLTAPNYKIFEPDALDAIYAKSVVSDPIMGGIGGAMGLAHSQAAMRGQNDYLASQDKFNRMAAALDAMEIDQRTKQKAMELGIGLIKEGEDATNIHGSENVFHNPAGALVPGMMRRKTESEIAKNYASGSGSGSGEKETTTESWTDTATGRDMVYKRQGKPGTTGAPPSSERGSAPQNAPVGSNPIPSKAAAITPQQIAARAEAAVGKGAKVIDQHPSGATLWQGPKGTVEFSPNGVMKRN